MKQYIIYALQDPATFEIRYIGKSVNGLKRPATHTYPTVLEKDKTYKGNWIRQLVSKGLTPIIKVVQELNNLNEINEAEKYWIQYFKDLGAPLTNSTKGGMGRCGLSHTEETKKKIAEGQKNRKILRGKDHGMYGRKLTNEEKKLISERTKEKMNDPLLREHLSENHHLRTEIIDNYGNIYSSINDAHLITGLSRDSIRAILNGKKQSVKGYSFKKVTD